MHYTNEAFVTFANRTCATLHSKQGLLLARMRALAEKPPTPQIVHTQISLLRQDTALERAATTQLAARQRPAADRATIEKLLRSLSEESTDADNAANDIEHGQPTAALAARTKTVAALERSLARQLGLKDCGSLVERPT
jgi:hypothetical protein